MSAYDEIAKVYADTFGEPLVAGSEWVDPIYEMVSTAVECDPSVAPVDMASGEVSVRRTADVIAVITYGRSALVPTTSGVS